MIALPFRRRLAAGLALAAAVAQPHGAPAAANAPASDPLSASLLAMRALDERVAGIGHRMAVAALDLCPDRQWLPGFAVHDLAQYGGAYREAAIRAFGLVEGPAVLAVAPGGPADRAGLRVGDVLVRLDGEAVPRGEAGRRGAFGPVERAIEAIERAFVDGSAAVEVRRGEQALILPMAAERGCASRFQIVPSSRLDALADGRYVQLTTALAAYAADDDELASILAHEFAHNLLRHRARLDAAGASRRLGAGFGRSAPLVRATEIEADRLSVYLLERAGYDPEAAVRFWMRYGRRGLNFLASPTHPYWRQRIRLFQTEIAAIRAARAAGAVPVPDFLPAPGPAR